MGRGDKKSRKGKIWRKSYGKYRLRKRTNMIAQKIKKIKECRLINIDLDEEMQYLNEYLRTGGVELIHNRFIVKGIMEIKFDKSGKVIKEPVSPIVHVFSKEIYNSHLSGPLLTEEYIENYKTFVQKQTYYNQTFIETKEELDTFLGFYEKKSGWLFRGMNEAKYRLQNSLQREWLSKKLYNKNISFQDLIQKLINKALEIDEGSLKQYFNENDINTKNPIAVLSFLQHYGCATPLLDWTYDFKTSLFFAISGIKPAEEERRIDKYFSIYMIEEKYMTGANLKEMINDSLNSVKDLTKPAMIKRAVELGFSENYAEKALSDKSVQNIAIHSYGQDFLEQKLLNIPTLTLHPLFYFSDNDKYSDAINFALKNNLNVINQKGVFFWNSYPNLPYEQIGYNEFKKQNLLENYKFCKCLNINKSLENYVRKFLNQKGVTESFIYPEVNKIEFQSIAKNTIKEILKEL